MTARRQIQGSDQVSGHSPGRSGAGDPFSRGFPLNPAHHEDWKTSGRFWEKLGSELHWAQQKVKSISPLHRRWMEKNTHSHSYFEVALCLDGTHGYGLGGEVWKIEPGGVLFLPRGVPHDWWYSKTHHSPCKVLWLHFLPLGDVHINLVEHRPPRKIQSSSFMAADVVLEEDLRRACQLLFGDAVAGMHPPTGAAGSFLMFVLHRLCGHLADKGFRETPSAERRLLGQIKAHISSNLTDHLALQDLARVAGYSPFHFHRLFSEVEGMTPRQFIERERLRQARVLLRKGSSVTSAAFDSGFSSCSHFNRAFKKYYGVAPTTWLGGKGDSRPSGRRRAGRG